MGAFAVYGLLLHCLQQHDRDVLDLDVLAGFALGLPRASFDSLLFAHVLEHMDQAAGIGLVRAYLPYLRQGGRLCVITPQERGYRSDATHVQFVDFDRIHALLDEIEMTVEREFSFPLPRALGRMFTYNEFVVVAGHA